MGAFQNIGVSDYLKRYGWKYGIQRGAFTAFPFHVVNDYENKKICSCFIYDGRAYIEKSDIQKENSVTKIWNCFNIRIIGLCLSRHRNIF